MNRVTAAAGAVAFVPGHDPSADVGHLKSRAGLVVSCERCLGGQREGDVQEEVISISV